MGRFISFCIAAALIGLLTVVPQVDRERTAGEPTAQVPMQDMRRQSPRVLTETDGSANVILGIRCGSLRQPQQTGTTKPTRQVGPRTTIAIASRDVRLAFQGHCEGAMLC